MPVEYASVHTHVHAHVHVTSCHAIKVHSPSIHCSVTLFASLFHDLPPTHTSAFR